jgi:hypothetical protein
MPDGRSRLTSIWTTGAALCAASVGVAGAPGRGTDRSTGPRPRRPRDWRACMRACVDRSWTASQLRRCGQLPPCVGDPDVIGRAADPAGRGHERGSLGGATRSSRRSSPTCGHPARPTLAEASGPIILDTDVASLIIKRRLDPADARLYRHTWCVTFVPVGAHSPAATSALSCSLGYPSASCGASSAPAPSQSHSLHRTESGSL